MGGSKRQRENIRSAIVPYYLVEVIMNGRRQSCAGPSFMVLNLRVRISFLVYMNGDLFIMENIFNMLPQIYLMMCACLLMLVIPCIEDVMS